MVLEADFIKTLAECAFTVPLVIGLLQLIKGFNVSPRFFPLIGLIIEAGIVFLAAGFSSLSVLVAIALGLSVSGMYELGKTVAPVS